MSNRDKHDEMPEHAPSPFKGALSPGRGRKLLSITFWGGLLAAAAAVCAALGWTNLIGEQLHIARLLFVLFGTMAATALIGRLVIEPA